MRYPAFLPFAGFTLNLMADILCFHGTTAFSSLKGFDHGVFTIALIVSRIFAYALSTSFLWQKKRVGVSLPILGVGCALLITLGFAILLTAPGGISLTRLLISAFLIGICQATLNLRWLSFLPSLSYRGSYLFILGGHATATAICLGILLAPAAFYPWIALAFYLLACLCASFKQQTSLNAFTFHQQILDIAPLLGKGILAVSLFAFMSGLLSSLTFTNSNDATVFQYAVQGISGAVIVAMAIPALILKQPLKLEESYRVALWLSAVGFLLLPGLTRSLPVDITGTLATTGYMVCGIVLCCTIAEVCKTSQTLAIPFFAASEVVTLSCLLVGNLLGTAYTSQSAPLNPSQGYSLLAIAGFLYIVATGALWLQRLGARGRNKPHNQPEELSPNTDKPVQLPDPADKILQQLLQGRTMARIAEDLYLSQSAVKYHAQKIYRLYNVHTRDELLALFRPSPALQVTDALSEAKETPTLTPVALIAEKFDLSDREKEVLAQINQGSSIATMVQTLDISQNTIKTHIKHLYKKLGVHSRQEVIDLLQEEATVESHKEPTTETLS